MKAVNNSKRNALCMDDLDDLTRLLAQSQAVVDMLQSNGGRNLRTGTVANAAWALSEKLDAVQAIVVRIDRSAVQSSVQS